MEGCEQGHQIRLVYGRGRRKAYSRYRVQIGGEAKGGHPKQKNQYADISYTQKKYFIKKMTVGANLDEVVEVPHRVFLVV